MTPPAPQRLSPAKPKQRRQPYRNVDCFHVTLARSSVRMQCLVSFSYHLRLCMHDPVQTKRKKRNQCVVMPYKPCSVWHAGFAVLCMCCLLLSTGSCRGHITFQGQDLPRLRRRGSRHKRGNKHARQSKGMQMAINKGICIPCVELEILAALYMGLMLHAARLPVPPTCCQPCQRDSESAQSH